MVAIFLTVGVRVSVVRVSCAAFGAFSFFHEYCAVSFFTRFVKKVRCQAICGRDDQFGEVDAEKRALLRKKSPKTTRKCSVGAQGSGTRGMVGIGRTTAWPQAEPCVWEETVRQEMEPPPPPASSKAKRDSLHAVWNTRDR